MKCAVDMSFANRQVIPHRIREVFSEEAGGAYKNVDDVVEATERAGLCRRVVRLLPMGDVKG